MTRTVRRLRGYICLVCCKFSRFQEFKTGAPPLLPKFDTAIFPYLGGVHGQQEGRKFHALNTDQQDEALLALHSKDGICATLVEQDMCNCYCRDGQIAGSESRYNRQTGQHCALAKRNN